MRDQKKRWAKISKQKIGYSNLVIGVFFLWLKVFSF